MKNNPSKDSLNLTDPAVPIMKGKKGDFDANYNVQTACTEQQIITFCDVVTAGNDKGQLIPAIEGSIKNTGKEVKKVLADADYGTFESLEYMVKHNIEGYVPYRNMNTRYPDQPYHTANFDYDNAKDVYICPENQELKFYRIHHNKKRNQNYFCYRTDACKKCPFQKQCCKKGTARRVIERETRQGLRDEMKQRLNSQEGKKMYQRRLHPIEAIFGHLKFNLGYTHFLLRGLEKVKAEFTLMCLAHNLRKLMLSIFCFLLNIVQFFHIGPSKAKSSCYFRDFKELRILSVIHI